MTTHKQAAGRAGPAAARPLLRSDGAGTGGGAPTPQAAEWIRDHAWTQGMRKAFRECPGFYLVCSCEHGTTQWCQQDRHDRCHRATPQRNYETVICVRDGKHGAYFGRPYEHDTDASATGPSRSRYAMVWLADRVCRWVCRCDCHSAPAAPEQLDLFAGVG